MKSKEKKKKKERKYWIDQKIHLSFSVTSYRNWKEIFGQPNTKKKRKDDAYWL